MEETMMNTNKEVVENEVVGDVIEASGDTSGKGMVIAVTVVAGLTAAVFAGVKIAKKLIAKHKSKKEAAKAKENDDAIEADFEDIEKSDDED